MSRCDTADSHLALGVTSRLARALVLVGCATVAVGASIAGAVPIVWESQVTPPVATEPDSETLPEVLPEGLAQSADSEGPNDEAAPAGGATPKDEAPLSAKDDLSVLDRGSRGKSKSMDLPSYSDRFLRMIYTLGAMLLALFLVAKFLPRLLKTKEGSGEGGLFSGLTGSGRRMQIVERMRIDGRKSLCLVRVGGRYLLLGVSDQRIERIAGEDLDVEALADFDDPERAKGDGSRPSAAAGESDSDGSSGQEISAFGSGLLRRAKERESRQVTDNRGDVR